MTEPDKGLEICWTKKTNNCSVQIGPNGVLHHQFDGAITQFARFKKIGTVDFYNKAGHIVIRDNMKDKVMMTIGGPSVVGIDVAQVYKQIMQGMAAFWKQP